MLHPARGRVVVAAVVAALLIAVGVGAVLLQLPRENRSLEDATRVLQSVSATLSSDGVITDLEGAVVATTRDDETRSFETSYSPRAHSDKFPVRVRTSYRTDEGTGTDLSDLEGHDGPIEINLDVENLTVKPQELSYDVGGAERTQSALVGVPLTVVASASLGDLSPVAVVTGDSEHGTNGVLSRTEDSTQVQWATILAPPQLGSSATLRLVVDGDDFEVPDFDLSVQPGLVTDPSVGALVNAAFNPAASEELSLQQRTIALIGDVNTVLGRASEAIIDVRRTLDSSSETIGTKTVEDLSQSTESIASSMSSLNGAVESLGKELASTLESTRSTAVAQLQSSVQALSGLLGDTSQQVPTVTVSSNGCEATVPAPRRTSTLYGSLLGVIAQLDGYAATTDACKGFVQQRLLSTIGPADAAECPEVPEVTEEVTLPVTCVLFDVAAEFDEVAADLSLEREQAVNAVNGLPYEDLAEANGQLSTAIDQLMVALEEMETDGVDAALASLDIAQDELRGLEDEAESILDDASEVADTLTSQLTQRTEFIRSQVCNLQVSPHPLDPAPKDRISRELVGRDCGESTGDRASSLFTDLEATRDSWLEVVDRLDTDADENSLGASLAETRAALTALGAALDQGTVGAEGERVGGVKRLYEQTRDLSAQVERETTAIDRHLGEIAEQRAAAIEQIRAAFAAAERGVTDDAHQTVERETARLVERATEDSRDIGRAFDRSANGLRAAGDRIERDGRTTVREQQRELGDSSAQAESKLSDSVSAGLGLINESVTGSVRDTEAASALLQSDLQNVLLDLGTREVDGSGLLGAMATGAASAGSADFQLALATDKTSGYAEVRDRDIAGLFLRQAQADAAFGAQAELPAFALDLPSGAEHRTVYNFHVRASR